MKSLDGKKCRIKEGTADRLNAAFKVLGVESKTEPIVKQTRSSLTINGHCIQAVRSYTHIRSMDFDSKVYHTIKAVLSAYNVDIHSIYASHKVFKEEVGRLEPKFTLGQFGDTFSESKVTAYLAAIGNVQLFLSDRNVQKCLEEVAALSILFDYSQYSEVEG